jgi:superfamily I DNA/RNA helicase
MNSVWWVSDSELDDQQAEVIALPLGKSYLITGPPGSGKTNLLLLRANYVYLAGHRNIAVIVFTRTLQEFISSGSGQYDFPPEKLSTSTKFWHDLLYQYGSSPSLPTEFEERRKALIAAVSALIQKEHIGALYDTIFLDEGQDYLPEEIELFRHLSKALFVTADQRQKIYNGDSPLDSIRGAVDQEVVLPFHYRIGVKICRVADTLLKNDTSHVPLEPSSQYPEASMPSKVQLEPYPTLAEQASKVIVSLALQLKTYPGELLGVICPTREVLAEVRSLIEQSSLLSICVIQSSNDVLTFQPTTCVCVCTIHASKGLEFRTVHLVGAEHVKKFRNQRKMAFTAITRAKTTLSIYHSGSLPGYFEEAVDSVQAYKPLPNMKAVFGKKGS